MPSESYAAFQHELEAGLHNVAARSQQRTLAEIRGINFCSNDYLGLAEHPGLKEAVLSAVHDAPRVGGTGSRLLSGHAAIWEELEGEFARFAGTEAALYFGSGYAANLGLLGCVMGREDLVFSDAMNHASLIDGIRLSRARRVVYPHLDLNALETGLRAYASEKCRKFIVTETVFSMDGNVACVAELLDLGDRYGATLIVDEAHATAVHGPRGQGIAARDGGVERVAAVVHTCGKALASVGAFVCGSALLREHLINHARTFLFTTTMPPYMAGQIRAALRLALGMDAEREELQSRAERFASSLRAQGWDIAGSVTQIVPVVLGGNEEALGAAEFLQAEGIAVRAIRPPTVPEGQARLRFSLTSSIQAGEIHILGDALGNWRACRHGFATAGRA